MNNELEFRVVSRGATAEDTAAVTAVLRSAVEEHALELEAEHVPTTSTWQRTRRSMRRLITPGPGHWRGFTA